MDNIPKKPNKSVRFLHISDTHLWPSNQQVPIGLKGHHDDPWKAIWTLINPYNIDAILWTGDIATASNENAYDLTTTPQGPLSIPARVRTINGMNVYSVPGNHDYFGTLGPFPYRSRNQTTFAKHFQPLPGPDVHIFTANDLTFVIFRVDSSSGKAANVDYAKGNIHRLDLDRISSWENITKNGEKIDGKTITPEELRKTWNILLMHHELNETIYYQDLDGDDKKILLKFIASFPIHIVACGHLHVQNVSLYNLFGKGRLDSRQYGSLKTKGLLRARDVLISRSGSTSCNGSEEYCACILEFTESEVKIFPLSYINNTFSLNGPPISRSRIVS